MTASSSAGLPAKLRRLRSQLPFLPRALRLVWDAAHGWTVLWAALLVAQGLVPVALVYLTKAVVDGTVAAIDAGGTWEAIRPALLYVLLAAAVMLTQELLRAASSYVRAVQAELVTDHIYGLIHDTAVAADFAFYETPEYHDHLHRARSEAGYRPLAIVEGLGSLLQNSLTLVSMLLVLAPYAWWLPFALLVSTLPALLVVIRYGRRQHRWRRKATPDQRRTWYYDYLLTRGESAAELRLFDLGPYFDGLYRALRVRVREEQLAITKRQKLAELAAGAFGLVVGAAALAVMVWRAIRGGLTLGDLALFYQAFNQGQRLMRTLLEGVGQLVSNSLFLGDLFEYLSLEPRVVDPPDPLPAAEAVRRSIRFNEVTFRYPGAERAVLEGFELTIPAGQVVAIVGPNGSGKSTLFKLLCRLYDPDAGAVEFDGVDIRSYRVAELRRLITVLFQEPVEYSLTAGENIALGDLAAVREIGGGAEAVDVARTVAEAGGKAGGGTKPGGAKPGGAEGGVREYGGGKEAGGREHGGAEAGGTAAGGGALDVSASVVAIADPRRLVQEAARAAGADSVIARLPDGYDALLGKWFEGGHELSVGEWQRIALARAFLRRGSILLLDEPTSAMDSWAEADWMARFRDLAAGRTVLVITHRFTTAMHADTIHVLVDGRVAESGTHAELIAGGGLYASSWATQMAGVAAE